MQTMPTFVYLAPLTLFFLIGPASAVDRHRRSTRSRRRSGSPRTASARCPASTVEATDSLGATRRQRLLTVLLPMARRTIVLGINQTIMAALSMVTIAALIDAPGLGKTVIKALQTLDVGTAFNAGLAIVVLAIVLDRTTTASSQRAEVSRRRHPAGDRAPAPGRSLAGAVRRRCSLSTLSRTYLWAARVPDRGDARRLADDVGLGASSPGPPTA